MPARERFNLDFASIIEDSLNEIYIFDEQSWKFILVNRAARENIGYSMDELQDLTAVDIKPHFSNEQFREVVAPLQSGDIDKLNFQTVHQRKDGSQYEVDVHLQIQTFDGNTAFVALIIDTTEKTKTSEELEFSKSLLESAPDAMVVADEFGRVIIANRQMEKLLGYSSQELLTMNVDEFVPLEHRAEHVQHREDYRTKPRVRGMGSDLDLAAVTKSGNLIPIEVSLSPIENQGQKMVAAAIRDISTRKVVEAKLRESEEQQRLARQEAENATLTKSRFLAAASHDLRQPLQALRLYLSAMTSRSQDEKIQELSKKMHLSLDTMGELLEALLDISALESGNIQAEIQQVHLRSMLERLIAANTPQVSSKGLKFITKISDLAVNTDPGLLERILENFISNAIRYTNEGSITLETLVLDDKVRIVVRDTGIGIPEAALETVFEEYYQLDNAVRDRSKGLGLGLSIVKHIARILDHEVHADSHLGQGSSFSVDVPISEEFSELQADNVFSISLLAEAQQVLIIDDDTAIVDAMAEILSQHDINTVTAYTGIDALKKVIKGQVNPTLIISDYRMPQMDGVETVAAIREELERTVPVLIMTGDTTVNLIKQTALKNIDVLTKPINESTMTHLINLIKQAPDE
jgi:PAS domain S-box-containing protein